LDSIPTLFEKRMAKKRKREMAPYKWNVSMRYDTLTLDLVLQPILENVFADDNRAYPQKITHLHAWQLLLLAAKLKHLIERPRLRSSGGRPGRNGPNMKPNYLYRLFYCLEWLNDGAFHRTQGFWAGWSKSSMHEDVLHVLYAIIEGLDDQLKWPDENRQQELANFYNGIFHGCIGLADVKEYQIVKSKELVKERRSWSGKKNSYKCLSVVDHSGRYMYCRVMLGNYDREVYTSSDLYLQEGSFFSGSQWGAVDGGFEGDGRFVCSYKNPGNDRNCIDFNNAFCEVRTLKENSYQRVGIWFPLLGNNKRKLPYKRILGSSHKQTSFETHFVNGITGFI
jgi:hypothetical protein